MLHLAIRAFTPARLPFPIMHVDTGHNFPELIEFRDRVVKQFGVELVVASVQESIDAGRVVEDTGPRASRNPLQTITLLDAIAEHRFDAVFGGARRDEERARAKERVVQPSRRVRSVGPQEPAARTVGAVQQPPQARRAPPHLPAVELDRARHLAIRERARRRAARPVLRPPPRRLPSGRDADGRQPVHRDARRRGVVRGDGAVPHDRRRHVHRCRRVGGRHRSTTSSPRPASPG